MLRKVKIIETKNVDGLLLIIKDLTHNILCENYFGVGKSKDDSISLLR